jgi:hypothetical protein
MPVTVLGGLENICPECAFTCFFGMKQTISTSCPNRFEINVYYSVLFYMLYIFNLMSGVCKSQVNKFCRVVPEYRVCFMLHFWQENVELSYRFLKKIVHPCCK